MSWASPAEGSVASAPRLARVDDNAAAPLLGRAGSVVALFTNPACIPGRTLGEALRGLAAELPVDVVAIDTDALGELTRRYGVHAVPTLLFLRDGQVVARRIGELPHDDLVDWVTFHVIHA